ncbi:MAG: hypothetical protein WC385_00830 [Candidatus Paceibacterota bacterium]|jgi:hypothetical protein
MTKKIFFSLLLVSLFFVSFPPTAKAAGMVDFYGGVIEQVTYCTCWYDLAVVVHVKDIVTNRTIKLKYVWYLSTLHPFYQIFTSQVCVIGGYTKGSPKCRNTSGWYCSDSGTKPDGTIDYVRGIGTSGIGCTTGHN